MLAEKYAPIRAEIIEESEVISRGVYKARIDGRQVYLKYVAEIHMRLLEHMKKKKHDDRISEYLTRLNVALAKDMADFYQHLVDIEVYPPSTWFIVCETEMESNRYPTIMAIMPSGEKVVRREVYEKAREVCLSKLENSGLDLKDFFTTDTEAMNNYVKYEGNVYYTDLHLFDFHRHIFLMPDGCVFRRK